jgi:hypothetical protein
VYAAVAAIEGSFTSAVVAFLERAKPALLSRMHLAATPSFPVPAVSGPARAATTATSKEL